MAINSKSHIFWNPEIVLDKATDVGMTRLMLAGEILAQETRSTLKSVIRHHISRPVYKTGKNAGKFWTARDAGEMLRSVRVVKSTDTKNSRNVWVVVGHSKAYYATMFERAASPARGVAFFRPSIARSKRRMIAVIEGGV